jgi:3-isopropylmalate/(R)-2-methylmalate dehydratase small subunit
MGRALFADWRYDAQGRPKPDFVLNTPAAAGARVLVAGRNFGCGSSREHAVWALAGCGFQAVVSSSFADIFRSNALKNGLLPVIVDGATHEALLAAPGAEVTIDLGERTLQLAGGRRATFPIDPFARYCLMNGVDELAFLLSRDGAIAAHEKAAGPLPWRLQ